MSRLAFHRPARFLPPRLPDQKIMLPVPPEAPAAGAGSMLAMILPLLSSVGMAGYMITFGRPIMIMIGVLFIVVSIGVTIAMRMQMRSTNRSANKKQRIRYRTLLDEAREQARQVAATQRMISALTYPDPQQLWGIATTHDRVWERRQTDPDFLHVRIGLGEVELATPIQLSSRLDPLGEYDWDSLRAADRLVSRHGRVDRQPSVVDVGGAGVISVLGPSVVGAALVRAVLCQIAVMHAPDDVAIAVDICDGGDWEWLKWLPHTAEPGATSEAGVMPLVSDGSADLAAFLERDLLHRREQQAARRGQLNLDRSRPPAQQRLVVVFTSFAPVSEWGRSDLLRALVEGAGPQLGITLIFLGQRELDEPGRVDLRIRLTDAGQVSLEGRGDLVSAAATRCTPDLVDGRLAELIARRLAPLRLSDHRDMMLTRTVTLSDMLLAGDPLTIDITARWEQANSRGMLRVPIGTDADGEPVVLDIKESAQGGSGPHGLIVGATGSGKSELLRTLVTGLSLTHSPELLSFVLVDFKGGAAFAPLSGLPHVSGLITNLVDDVAMIERVHAALMGEQQRRQRMLRDAGNVDSVREYQMRQAAGVTTPGGEPLEPLPYLMIIVDEFGELLSGRPELTELFVQIGRVGRSLGMHLLLATQRLEEGRLRGLDSHLSYRICLRTFSAAESRVVIGTPDAYHLPPIPGSAYVKVDESIFRRFRVAHVSSLYQSAEQRASAVGVSEPVVAFGIRPAPVVAPAEPEEPAGPSSGPTELAVVVDRLRMIGRPAHQVWLPPLPAAIALDQLIGAPGAQPGRGLCARDWSASAGLTVAIGIIDRPLQQDQQLLLMDFGGAQGHLAVVGAPQTGRSTLLRTIMLSAMLTHTPEEAQFYCIDYGGATLYPYAAAPHVAAVAGRNDETLTGRILAEIMQLITSREQLFRTLGLGSIAELRARRAAGRLPADLRAADVFLLIDNWGAVRAVFDSMEPTVTEIAGRGLGAGVHLVLAANRWSEIRPALRDSIGTRIELRLNDPSESEINRRLASQVPAGLPGRGLAGPGVFFHLALPRMDGVEGAEGIREAQDDVLGKIAAGWAGPPAPPVRLLPARITVTELETTPVEDSAAVAIGIGQADLRPVALDLVTGGDPHLMVFGDAGAGKTTFLRTWIQAMTRRYSGWEARFVVFDYRRSLLGVVPEDHLGAYAADAEAVKAYIGQLTAKLRARLPPSTITPQELAARSWWEGPEVYVVIDDYDLVGGGAQGPLSPLIQLVPHARDLGFHLVIARRVTGSSRTSISDQLGARLRELGCGGLILSGEPREGVLMGDERAAARPPGRGVLIQRGQPNQLVQLAVADEGLVGAAVES